MNNLVKYIKLHWQTASTAERRCLPRVGVVGGGARASQAFDATEDRQRRLASLTANSTVRKLSPSPATFGEIKTERKRRRGRRERATAQQLVFNFLKSLRDVRRPRRKMRRYDSTSCVSSDVYACASVSFLASLVRVVLSISLRISAVSL